MSENNWFAELSIEPFFDLCPSLLEQAYIKAQLNVHPDLWRSALIKEKCQFVSARLNQAYQILKDPLLRAQHMMELHGYWPVPVHHDLTEDFFDLQSQLETGILSENDLKKKFNQSYTDLCESFQNPNKETLQREYWKFSNISKLCE